MDVSRLDMFMLFTAVKSLISKEKNGWMVGGMGGCVGLMWIDK